MATVCTAAPIYTAAAVYTRGLVSLMDPKISGPLPEVGSGEHGGLVSLMPLVDEGLKSLGSELCAPPTSTEKFSPGERPGPF